MKIVILLSTYNGEKYLAEQLNSLLNQDIKYFDILIRDDGSKDNTLNILEDYSSKYKNIKYYVGNNMGPARSFFELIKKAGNYDYYSLCDQDDVWFNNKLSTAIKTLNNYDNRKPLLYASRFTLTDKDLNPINSKISKLYSFSDFEHSLIYHSAPGCTFLFNKKAREKILQYDLNREFFVIHDAIIHKVVAMLGTFILDNNSYMYYRQHGDNEIGMTANVFKSFISRINNFVSGNIKNYRSNSAKSLLRVYENEIDSDKQHLLEVLAYYRENKEFKKELLNNEGFKTGTINDLFFKILVILNYI